MRSPFFWQNTLFVALIVANFALSVFWVTSSPGDPKTVSVARIILLRSLSVSYCTVSTLILIYTVIQYADAEFSDNARACWKRRSDWKLIQPGMTKTKGDQILGPAFHHFEWYEMDRNDYKLHALDTIDSAIVYYSLVPENGTEEGKVVEKSPTDVELAEENSRWLPFYEGRGYLTLKDRFIQTAMAFSYLGLILLAVATLLPVWNCTDCSSLVLYLPVSALVLCFAYEYGQKGGWRCDVILLIPMYAIILGMWIYRVVVLVRS